MPEKYDLNPVVKVLDWYFKQSGGWNEDTLESLRNMKGDYFARGFAGKIKLYHIEDRDFYGRHGRIPVRVYRATARLDAPLIIFYHGGGFTTGTIEGHDHICRTHARNSEAVVISVGYRLAPEHKFPVAPEDAYDAFCEAYKTGEKWGANPEKLFLVGDSAGGNLAAVVTLMAREHNNAPRISGQVLVYPPIDATGTCESRRLLADAPILSESSINFFKRMYLNDDSERLNPYCSPILASSHQDLPPALVQIAEYDPLRDEGIAYAEKLRAAGVEVETICYPRTVHGFYNLGVFMSATNKAYADIARFIQQHV